MLNSDIELTDLLKVKVSGVADTMPTGTRGKAFTLLQELYKEGISMESPIHTLTKPQTFLLFKTNTFY